MTMVDDDREQQRRAANAKKRSTFELSPPVAYPPSAWLTIDEAAAYARTTVDALRIRMRQGKLKADGKGHKGAHLFRASTIDAHVASLAAPAPQGAPMAAAHASRVVPTSPQAEQTPNARAVQSEANSKPSSGRAREMLAEFKARQAAEAPAKPKAKKETRKASRAAVKEWLYSRRSTEEP